LFWLFLNLDLMINIICEDCGNVLTHDPNHGDIGEFICKCYGKFKVISKEKCMTVRQLKEELNKYPDSMEVFVAERKTEFAYGLVNSVIAKEVSFSEDPDGEPMASDKVVVIDEE
jgi:hypothetical protein